MRTQMRSIERKFIAHKKKKIYIRLFPHISQSRVFFHSILFLPTPPPFILFKEIAARNCVTRRSFYIVRLYRARDANRSLSLSHTHSPREFQLER